ncbi:unnamed protein product [Closterium sp. NIES-54]
MTTLQVLLHIAAKRDYKLHSLDFSTAFLQGSLHEEIGLRRPSSFTESFPAGTQWSLRRPVYGLRQVPREWHDTLRTTLAALGFAPATADPMLFLRTDTSLPPFYVLVTSCLNSSTPTTTTATATTPTAATTATPTPTAATTAATKASTPATTPTTATTSAISTASAASTTTTPAAIDTTLATLALAAVALPTERKSSPDILST